VTLNSTERHRILLATTLTILALPALWWANQSEGTSAPNIATVGVEVGTEGETASTSARDTTQLDLADQLEKTDPVFFDGPASNGGGAAEIAVPAAPRQELITTSATFSSALSNTTLCRVPGVGHDIRITVVNLDNNRSTSCVTVLAPAGSTADLILHTSVFSEIADLTDAPIPVEIHR